MYGYIHGAHSGVMNFLDLLWNTSTRLRTFLSIPSMLIESSCAQLLSYLDEYHDQVYAIESATGTRYDSSRTLLLDEIDLGKLTQDINFTTTKLAHKLWSCHTYGPMLSFLDSIAKQYREQVLLNGHSVDDATSIESYLLEKHEYLRCWLTGQEKRIEYLSQRAQAQVQTVSLRFVDIRFQAMTPIGLQYDCSKRESA